MEGELDQFTGQYFIENVPENSQMSTQRSKFMRDTLSQKSTSQTGNQQERQFMYCKYLHHPGLASI
jgi:hypothetical protein